MNWYEIEFLYEKQTHWMYCVVKSESKAKTHFNRQVKESGWKKPTLVNIRKMNMTPDPTN